MLDQRGTGANALRCPVLQEQVGTTDFDVPTADAVRDCGDAIGADRRFYSTSDTVADLEMLRTALGVESWTLDGVSYGSYVAERYLIEHPTGSSVPSSTPSCRTGSTCSIRCCSVRTGRSCGRPARRRGV